MEDLILIVAAIIPAELLLHRIYKCDRLEKEPTGLLLSLLVLGVAATSMASFVEQLGDIAVAWFVPEGTLLYDFLIYFVIVAITEEGFKYLLLKARTWRSPHFNCAFDGVVYAVFISLGFAIWENLGYVLNYGLITAAARAVTAVPGHACFGVFMGAWYGVAKRCETAGLQQECVRARRIGFWEATLLHGAYDFIAVRQTEGLSVGFVVFVLALFITSMRMVKKHAGEDDFFGQPPTEPQP